MRAASSIWSGTLVQYCRTRKMPKALAAPGISLVAECKLYETVELGLHTQFVGEIVDVKADESVIDGESANIELVKPFVYNTHRRVYYAIGDAVGPAFEMGKAIKG